MTLGMEARELRSRLRLRRRSMLRVLDRSGIAMMIATMLWQHALPVRMLLLAARVLLLLLLVMISHSTLVVIRMMAASVLIVMIHLRRRSVMRRMLSWVVLLVRRMSSQPLLFGHVPLLMRQCHPFLSIRRKTPFLPVQLHAFNTLAGATC